MPIVGEYFTNAVQFRICDCESIFDIKKRVERVKLQAAEIHSILGKP